MLALALALALKNTIGFFYRNKEMFESSLQTGTLLKQLSFGCGDVLYASAVMQTTLDTVYCSAVRVITGIIRRLIIVSGPLSL